MNGNNPLWCDNTYDIIIRSAGDWAGISQLRIWVLHWFVNFVGRVYEFLPPFFVAGELRVKFVVGFPENFVQQEGAPRPAVIATRYVCDLLPYVHGDVLVRIFEKIKRIKDVDSVQRVVRLHLEESTQQLIDVFSEQVRSFYHGRGARRDVPQYYSLVQNLALIICYRGVRVVLPIC